mmetsp:Transcript_4784/g.8925  ORF Transcript_4784/g.8925 Transcript_4784/m.8925 type:complete len:143 (+) Transcript_4784:4034-4462(+)
MIQDTGLFYELHLKETARKKLKLQAKIQALTCECQTAEASIFHARQEGDEMEEELHYTREAIEEAKQERNDLIVSQKEAHSCHNTSTASRSTASLDYGDISQLEEELFKSKVELAEVKERIEDGMERLKQLQFMQLSAFAAY